MNTPEKPAETLGKFARARGGKELVRFKDVLGNVCTIETTPGHGGVAIGGFSVRIGVEKAIARIQARDARARGMTTTQKTGLIKYPIPEEVQIDTAAVLARNQVAELIELLLRWLKRGSFEDTHGVSELLSLEPGLAPPQEAPAPPAEKTPDQTAVDEALKARPKRVGRTVKSTQTATVGATDDELAREEAAEFALDQMLETDGIPYAEREGYQERRRKGERYTPKSRGQMVE